MGSQGCLFPFSLTRPLIKMPLLQLVSYMFINISGQLSLLLNNYVFVNSSHLFNLFFQFVIFVPLSSPVINFKASGKKRVLHVL